jgi:GntR family transcriptional regulator
MNPESKTMSTSSPIPLYHRVNAVIRQRVADGAYPPGSKIPTEDELVAEFGVSRATVRQAVGALVDDGVVSRRQGRGTFVLEQEPKAMGQVFTGSLMDLIGEVRRTRMSDVAIEHGVAIPAVIAEQLQLPEPKGTVIRRTRLRDDVAFSYTVNYLGPEVGPKVTKKLLSSSSLMDLLEKQGHPIESARQTIRAQLADVEVSEALSISLASAVLFAERLNLEKDGSPIEFVKSWYRGDLYEFRATLDRSMGELAAQFA